MCGALLRPLCIRHSLVRPKYTVAMSGSQEMYAAQLQQTLQAFQAQIDQLSRELEQEKAVNATLRQQAKPAPLLPDTVMPALPACFAGKMDGTSVSGFCHQLDVYFKLAQLMDDVKQG